MHVTPPCASCLYPLLQGSHSNTGLIWRRSTEAFCSGGIILLDPLRPRFRTGPNAACRLAPTFSYSANDRYSRIYWRERTSGSIESWPQSASALSRGTCCPRNHQYPSVWQRSMTVGRTYQVARSLAATPWNAGALAVFHANVSKNELQHCRYAGRHKIWPHQSRSNLRR